MRLRLQSGRRLRQQLQRRLRCAWLSGRTFSAASSIMRSLSESLRVLVGLERQAYGIKEELLPPADPGVATFSTADLFAMRDALKGGV